MSAVLSQSTTAPDPGAVVAGLEHCDLNAMRLHWRNHLGSSAPAHLPRWLLMRILAYRLQVIAHGDLRAETKRLLGITIGRSRSSKNNRSLQIQDADVGSSANGTHDGLDPIDHNKQRDVDASQRQGRSTILFIPSQAAPCAFIKRAAVTRDGQELHPGSILAREWNDTMVRVMVGENGQFIFNGKAYGSLSQIAKLITGTNWNGHRFFGLKKGRS